jgi:hypothetical protein
MLSSRKIVLFRVIAVLLTLAVMEGLSAVTAALIPYPRIRRARTLYAEQSAQIRESLDRSVPHHVELHPVLGWRHTPNYPLPMNRMNSVGLRGTREYAPAPPAGVLRVAAFGDSFVYGAEVDNASSWTGRLEIENADLEVLNYGVTGYGVDQAFLRYLLEGQAFSPHVVLMGFVPDDINRIISVYRRFLSPGAALFKPRYVLGEHDELVLLESPLKTPGDYENLLTNPREIIRVGRNDYWYPACVYENPLHDYSATMRLVCAAGGQVYRRYLDSDRPVKAGMFNENSTAFKIQMALFRKFSAAVHERGAVPLIVMLPDQKAVDRVRRGAPPSYGPLMTALRKNNLAYLDAADALAAGEDAAATSTLFAAGGHYSESGNRRVAAWLITRLRKAATELPHSIPPSRGNASPQAR